MMPPFFSAGLNPVVQPALNTSLAVDPALPVPVLGVVPPAQADSPRARATAAAPIALIRILFIVVNHPSLRNLLGIAGFGGKELISSAIELVGRARRGARHRAG